MRRREIADGSRGTGHTLSQGAGLNRVAVLEWGPENNMDLGLMENGSSNGLCLPRDQAISWVANQVPRLSDA